MNHPEKSKKRIVSKAEYVALQSKKAALSWSGTWLLITGWLGISCSVFLGIALFAVGIMFVPKSLPMGIMGIAFIICLGYVVVRVGAYFINCAEDMIQKADAMDIGVLFTQANTANLPASESLVRASSEPVEEQESVLLRPATQSQKTSADQLLRSVEE